MKPLPDSVAASDASKPGHSGTVSDTPRPTHSGIAADTSKAGSSTHGGALPPVSPVAPPPPVPPVPPAGAPLRGKEPPPTPPGHRPGKSGNFAWLVVLLVVLCVALGAALWYQRQEFQSAGMNVATRIDTLSKELNDARSDMREALSLSQSQSAKIAALETAVRENQAEYSTLEQAWQDFNDTTNDGVLANDVERLLTIASQQLRLGGSVSNAIVALESAQSRLARADRPRFATLQQAVNGDLDRLRAVPVVDVTAQSARIERLSALVSKAPLLVPDAQSMNQASTVPADQAAPAPAPAAPVVAPVPADAPWWQQWRAEVVSWPARAGSVLTHELGDLIKVQRVDQPNALLMSASQSEQLRATLRQRLQTVQLALLMRQASVWKSELAIVTDTLNNYYEPRSTDTQAALRLVESLNEIPVAVALPEINDSLNAMAAVRSQASPETERN
ncbi:MAG: heme biosynthesis operon protein HemX [Comamonadaceae bacterium]|nr:MAG: heme biosynthesis operon protein HemX [Comamonadaceae bacterium]